MKQRREQTAPISEPVKPADWFVEMSKRIETQIPEPVDPNPTVKALPQKDGSPLIAFVSESATGKLAREAFVELQRTVRTDRRIG